MDGASLGKVEEGTKSLLSRVLLSALVLMPSSHLLPEVPSAWIQKLLRGSAA